MRIAVIHERYPPDIKGGGEILVEKTVEGLIERGHEVWVFTTSDKGHYYSEHNGRLKVFRLPVSTFKFNTLHRNKRIVNWIKDCDVIHAHTFHSAYPSWKIAEKLNKPIILTVLGAYGDKWKEMKGKSLGAVYKTIERRMIDRPFDRVHFLSNYCLDYVPYMSRRSTVVFPCGVDSNLYKPSMGKRGNYVLFMGRLSAQKGVYSIVEAAERLPGVEFIMAGEGEEYKALKKDAPKNVRLVGRVSESEKRRLMSRAAVFIAPSVCEGLGMVIQEAMASGCPIVSTVPMEFAGKGLETNSSEELSHGIRTVLSFKSGELTEMGRSNRELASSWTWESYIDNIETQYSQIMNEGGYE